MARLPTPMMVENLRFTGNMELQFTVKWASDDTYAAMIDHIRVRLMMTNLLDVGVDEDAVLAEMESWNDILRDTAGLSSAGIESLPTGWDPNLAQLHRIDYRSPVVVNPGNDNATPGDMTHEEDYTVTDVAFQQRFVRLVAQARTPN